MQLPINLDVFLVSCDAEHMRIIEELLMELRESPSRPLLEYDILTLSITNKICDDMRGCAVVIQGDDCLDEAVCHVRDMTLLSIGSSVASSELVRKGFVDAIPLDAGRERLIIALCNLVRETLLLRRLDLREQVIRTYMDLSENMLWTKDQRDYHMDVNYSLAALAGKSIGEIEGSHDIDIFGLDPGDQKSSASDWFVRKTGLVYSIEEVVPDKWGIKRHLHVVKAPWIDSQNHIVGTIGLGKDVTQLLDERIRFEAFLNSIGLAVAIVNLDGQIIRANATFHAIVGRQLSDGEDFASVVYSYLRPLDCSLNALERPDHDVTTLSLGDYQQKRGTEDVRVWSLTRFPLRDYWDNHTGYTYIFQDVTEARKQSRQIRSIATTDPLTGTLNRAGLNERYEAVGEGDRYTLLFLDIDFFKQINDTCGHSVGDRYLVDVAHLMKEIMPMAWITRYGGDEFLALIPGDVSRKRVEDMATDLLLRAHDLSAGVDAVPAAGLFSIGILFSYPIYHNLEAAILRCDQILYQSKKSGKNQYNIVDASHAT